MPAKNITFHYFSGIRGRGELPILVLKLAKQDFTEKRTSLEEWPSVKPNVPYNALPYMIVDGEVLSQSMAISSFFAREFGFYPTDNMDVLRLEMLHQMREELMTKEGDEWEEHDPIKKEAMKKELNEVIWPKYMGYFEKLIKENQARAGGSKFAVGKKLSLADILIQEGTMTLRQENPELLDKYPTVKAVADMVAELDGIKQYLASRPFMIA